MQDGTAAGARRCRSANTEPRHLNNDGDGDRTAVGSPCQPQHSAGAGTQGQERALPSQARPSSAVILSG